MSTTQYLAECIHSFLYQLFVERLLDAKHSMVFAIKEELGPGCSPVETAEKVNLNQIPLGRDVHSLVMRNDGALYHNNEEKNRLPANNLPQEGDVVGITYDHVELNVYLNGKNMHCPASGIRGTVYPVVYVDDSAILDCQFSEFYHTPPPGFEKILFEQQIF
ncbi:SPRY domain-containing protein 7, partial [Eschrichtius robustus]|nr:SPRY domain-containing protein 7 [Eschrichtius robustus]